MKTPSSEPGIDISQLSNQGLYELLYQNLYWPILPTEKRRELKRRFLEAFPQMADKPPKPKPKRRPAKLNPREHDDIN